MPPPTEMNMNINLRALIFGIIAATAITLTFDAVGSARERDRAIVRLDRVAVTANHQHFNVDGSPKVIRLEPVLVLARRDQKQDERDPGRAARHRDRIPNP